MEAAPEVGTFRVLLVDSGSASRAEVSTLLASCRYQVTTVRTAKEALQALHEATFDIVLKNHDPAVGVNACRFLRKAASSIPVVVIAEADDRQEVFRCLKLGAADYLVKPLRLQELRNIWTRVWWHQAIHVPSAVGIGSSPQPPCNIRFALSLSGSDGTKIEEDDEEPTSKEGSAPAEGTDVRPAKQLRRDSANRNSTTKPGSGGRLLGGDGSNTANGHGSNNANGASTTHVYASNGGGRTGGGADAPLVYRTTDAGSGEGSGGGSGGSRGAGNGSGQGSGSGNEALAAAGRSPPCASPKVLRTQLEAAAVQAAAADAPAAGTPGGLGSTAPPRGVRSGSRGNGSNGNSGVDDTGGEAVAAAKRVTAEARENAETAAALQGTAQGKHVPAVFAPKADGPDTLKRRSSSVSPKEAAAAAAAAVVSPFANACPAAARQSNDAAAPQVGFRAWVGRPQSSPNAADATASLRSASSGGLKRSASDALGGAASLPPPAARSVKARTFAAAPAGSLPGSGAGLSCAPSPRSGAGLSPMDRFGSAGTGTATGASDGTNFGGSGVLGGSGALGASIGTRRPSQQPSPKASQLQAVCSAAALMPPPSNVSQQLRAASAAASLELGQQQHQQQRTQQHAPQPPPIRSASTAELQRQSSMANGAAAASAWESAAAFQQLQAAQAQAQQQQQQAQQQAQQQQAQQQMQQMRAPYGFGGMPPHMVPPGYPTIPFGMWGSYAAAAAQQAQTQQQMQSGAAAAAAQQQQPQPQQQQQSPTAQQAQAFGLAQQQAQMQQAMLAGYPGYFMNSMNSFMGGFPGLQQTNWAQMQQAAAMQQQMAAQQAAQQAQQQQAQQQQPKQGRLPPGLPPRPPQSQAAAAPAAVNGWGSAVNGGAAANGSNANGQTQAGINGNGACSRAPTPAPVPGDGQPPSAAGADSAAVGTEDGDDECRAPSQKERRQQALHKFKQKRKNLCFTKKIRYESRKQLANARPRVRGQFVKIDSTAVEVLEGIEPPSSPTALAAAIEAGTARILDQAEVVAVVGKGSMLAEDDALRSDAEDDVGEPCGSPEAPAVPEAHNTRSQAGGGRAQPVGSGGRPLDLGQHALTSIAA